MTGFTTFLLFAALVSANPIRRAAKINVLVTNDDGWATAQVRSEFDALDATGLFNLILSCPAVDKSGTGNTTATPARLTAPCEFNTCPTGSPAIGFNATDPRLNYVNAFPVDAARFGIETLGPEFFNGQKPAFVVSGSNVGNNLGSGITGSGTCRAAAQAVMLGVPAVAFSGSTAAAVSYTTLETDPTSQFTLAAKTYNTLTVRLVETLLAANSPGGNILPPGAVVNVNYPSTTNCPNAANYKWVFTRLTPATSTTVDVVTCGNGGILRDERSAIAAPGCWVTVSVYDAVNIKDVDAATQGVVLNKLSPILSCQ